MSLTTSQQILELVKKSKRILIALKKNPDIDSMSSALALALFLKKLEKKVEIIADGADKKNLLSFLGNTDLIKPKLDNIRKFIISLDVSKTKVKDFSYDLADNNLNIYITPKAGYFENSDVSFSSSGFKFDLIFTINVPDMEAIGEIYDQNTEFFYNTPIINIDNQPNNEYFGQINLVELTATSAAEVVYSIIEKIDAELIDEEISTSLLTGLISKTNSFKTDKVTPKALSAASQLIANGADRAKIIQNLYQTRSINTLQLWGRALSRLKTENDNKIAWSLLSLKDFETTKTTEENLPDIIEELISYITEVEIIFLLFEQANNKIKAIFKVEKNHDALALTNEFNPKGTKEIVSFEISNQNNLKEAENVILEIIRNKANLSN